MGRLRIKKKDMVIPFRQTMAYRLVLAAGSLVLVLVTGYFLLKYLQSGNNVGIIASIAGAVMSVTLLFYNLGEVRNAKVPSSTLKRARRR
jgi:ethanolamine transporter EutH